MVMSDRWRMSPGLRRVSAVAAIMALAIGGAKVASDHTMPGTGFSTVQTAAADPTGPTGGPGDGGMNGGQFSPPQMPAQQPEYQGGNQPPLNQDNGISIYNSGNPQAPQQPGQQGAQQQPGSQQPIHGTQPPDYQTATPYTEGPGRANPDYQAPQQGNQAQQPQQGNQQPSQAPTQTQQPNQDNQQDRELKQQCEQQAQYYGLAEQMASFIASSMGGFGSMFGQPSRKWGPAFECNCAPQQGGPQKESPFTQTVTGTAVKAPEEPTPTPTPTQQQCAKPPFDEIPLEPEGQRTPNHSARDNKPGDPEGVQWIIMHTEGLKPISDEGRTALGFRENVLKYPGYEESYHYAVDNKTVVDLVDTKDKSNSANAFPNDHSINLLMADAREYWTPQEWLQKMGPALDIMAYIAVREAKANGVPARVISLEELQSGAKGIVDHGMINKAFGKRILQDYPPSDISHSDMGSNFPWDQFRQAVDKYAKCA